MKWSVQSVVSWNMVVFLALVLMAAVSVVEVNRTATRGMEIHARDQRLESLRLENEQLEREIAAARSAARVARSIPLLGLTPVGERDYVSLEGENVALK